MKTDLRIYFPAAALLVVLTCSAQAAVIATWGGANVSINDTSATGWNGPTPNLVGDVGDVNSGNVRTSGSPGPANWNGRLNINGNLALSGQLQIDSSTAVSWTDVHLNGGRMSLSTGAAGFTFGSGGTSVVTLENNPDNRISSNNGNFAANVLVTATVLDLSARLTGSGGFRKQGNATVRLLTPFSPSNFTGPVIVEAGILRLDSSNLIPDTVNVTVDANTDLHFNGTDTIGGLSGGGKITKNLGAGSEQLRVGGGDGNGDFSGVISNSTGTLNFTKLGSGVQTLSGANTFTGTKTLSGGTLIMADTSALGTTASVVAMSGGSVVDIQTDGGDNAYNFQIGSTQTVTIASDVKTGSVGIINYGGAWNGGLFTYNGDLLGNNDTFLAGQNAWRIQYNATSGGSNFTSDQIAGGYINITLEAAVVPEPATFAMVATFAVVLSGTGIVARLRKRRKD